MVHLCLHSSQAAQVDCRGHEAEGHNALETPFLHVKTSTAPARKPARKHRAATLHRAPRTTRKQSPKNVPKTLLEKNRDALLRKSNTKRSDFFRGEFSGSFSGPAARTASKGCVGVFAGVFVGVFVPHFAPVFGILFGLPRLYQAVNGTSLH